MRSQYPPGSSRDRYGATPAMLRGGATAQVGRANLWLRMTSSGWDRPSRTSHEREIARRSALTSWIILGLLIVVLVLVPGGLAAPATLAALGGVAVGLLLIAILNRMGQVLAAGLLLIGILNAAILYAVAGVQTGLSLIYLPAFDLFVITVVVAASVLPRGATFLIAALNCGLIVGDFMLQPHAADLQQAVGQFGAVGVLDRPIALQIIVAVVAYLWARGTDFAHRRADRAEEIAALEHTLADQKRQLDIGIQQILQTHVRAANGDYSARAPLGQDNLLWQIASSLNNLLSRLQRTGQDSYLLQRVTDEARRLAAAIDDAQAGRKPIWPAPTGTPMDLILERIRGARRGSQQEPFPPSGASQPMSGFPGGSPSGWQDQAPLAQRPTAPWPEQAPPAPTEPPAQSGWQMPPAPQQDGGWQMEPPLGEPPLGERPAQEANPWAFPQDER
jgi:hypothetical protein